ncbi:T9SS type A sorting domain-containing protein [Candidatus Zixiibacteriota bacterium]
MEIIPGYYNSWASAVNDAGTAVGLCEWLSGEIENIPPGVQTLWRGTTPIEICAGISLSGPTARPYDVNNSEWVVGNRILTVEETEVQRAYLWRDGSFTDVHPHYPGPEYESIAVAVNDSGQVAGYFTQLGLWPWAFLWENDTVYILDSLLINDGSPPRYANDSADIAMRGGQPLAINNNGDILTVAYGRQNTYNFYQRIDTTWGTVVNSVGDSSDIDPNDGICWTGGYNSLGDKECTFRAAIEHTNAQSGLDTISFDIPGGGIPVIYPSTKFPDITEAVFIDGASQPGYNHVELNGRELPPDTSVSPVQRDAGLVLTAGNSAVQGLMINKFPGNGLTLRDGDSNFVSETIIGTDIDTTQNLGNAGHGVFIDQSSVNFIGAYTRGFENVICHNGGAGIFITGDAQQNTLQQNMIHSNGGLGIDLAPEGVTQNDAGDTDTGPNNLQNFPVIDSIVGNLSDPQIYGTVTSYPNANILLEFFINDQCDSSGHGEGRWPVATKLVTADNSGQAMFSTPLMQSLGECQAVSATAIAGRNTSEFSRCWSQKCLEIVDANDSLIREKTFSLYRVANDPPVFTDTLFETVTTDSQGRIPLSTTQFEIGDSIKVHRRLHTVPSKKRANILGTVYSVYLDNAQFDSISFQMSYDEIDSSTIQTIKLDHTTLAFNFLVSIEWDAGLEYLDSLQQCFRHAANYLYDVSDGQIRFDTVLIVDDRAHWRRADILVCAENISWPRAYRWGIYMTPMRKNSPMYMPRRWFGNLTDCRNMSVTEQPLNPAAVMHYRTMIHEFGHLCLGFLDEYKFIGSTTRCALTTWYGFMESQYYDPWESAAKQQSATEMSWSRQYTDSTCQNTLQYYIFGSCWDRFEQIAEKVYSGVPAPIIKPDERHPSSTNFFEGPNDGGAPSTYDVGALVVFPGTITTPTASNRRATVRNEYTNHLLPDVNVWQWNNEGYYIDQGNTSDSGVIILLGVDQGDWLRVGGNAYLTVSPRLAQASAAISKTWFSGTAEISGVPGDSLTVLLKQVAGNYPLICDAHTGSNDLSLMLTSSNQFSQNPTLTMYTEGGDSYTYDLSLNGSVYLTTITDEPEAAGSWIITAVDDSSDEFFFALDYSVASGEDTTTLMMIDARGGDGSFFLEHVEGITGRALVTSTDYPVIRSGLDPQSLQAGRSHAFSVFSDEQTPTVGVTIMYEDSDFAPGVGSFGDELSLRVFRWDYPSAAWQLIGGSVDTLFNRVMASSAEIGVFAAFTTDADVTAPSTTMGVLQNPLLPSHIEIYIVVDEPLSTAPTLTVNDDPLELTAKPGETTPIYSALYQLSVQSTITLRAVVTDLAANVTDTTVTFESYPAGSQASTWISGSRQLQLGIPQGALDRHQHLLLFAGSNEAGNTFDIRPRNLKLKRQAKLRIDARAIHADAEPEQLVIARQEVDGTWEPLPTAVDPQTRVLMAYTDRLGVYQPRHSTSPAAPVPKAPSLAQNYPNPFNASTVVEFALPRPTQVSLEVFNILGRRVAVLVDEERGAGRHLISWDGKDNNGKSMASGLYFYRLRAGSYSQTKRMVLLK